MPPHDLFRRLAPGDAPVHRLFFEQAVRLALAHAALDQYELGAHDELFAFQLFAQAEKLFAHRKQPLARLGFRLQGACQHRKGYVRRQHRRPAARQQPFRRGELFSFDHHDGASAAGEAGSDLFRQRRVRAALHDERHLFALFHGREPALRQPLFQLFAHISRARPQQNARHALASFNWAYTSADRGFPRSASGGSKRQKGRALRPARSARTTP